MSHLHSMPEDGSRSNICRQSAALLKHPRRMPQPGGTIRRITEADLSVGVICADRDGNRVRIDAVDRTAGRLAYHYLNDELRVQEGVQEIPIEEFVKDVWYVV